MADSTRTCTVCGSPLPPRKTKVCSRECRMKRLVQSDAYARGKAKHRERMRTDSEYRKRYNARERENAKRRDKKQSRATVVKRCGWCDAEFTTRASGGAQACSTSHGMHLRRYLSGDVLASKWQPPKPKPEPKSDKWEGVARFTAGYCRRCGEAFVHDRKVTAVDVHYCSLRCARAVAKDRRRARKRDAYVADVWRAKVYERDRYRCHICGKRLAMKQAAPHPKAPVIDHIIPLAAGGTHEMANVAAAHFICNSRKGHRAANDQLLLVG